MPGCGPLSSSTRTPGSGGNSAPRGGTTSAARSMRSVSVTPSLLCKYQTTFVLLESYNEAVTFSSGKGLAHTLARRAGFLLQTGEHMLALRDLHLGARTENKPRKQNIVKGNYIFSSWIRLSWEWVTWRANGSSQLRQCQGFEGGEELGEKICKQVRKR